ncbi:hypothetical protein [Paraburkholderia tropica]|uniref:hypothetical protein n=1 Tax=Paraburkholderia tropica TaxID=92647 RepID=UPI002AB66D48|nr:hypothetical protein [Paraburkholderia tropica]
MNAQSTRPHYQLNICRGDFRHVCECFATWKSEPLVYRLNQKMFEGRSEVRPLSDQCYDDTEKARKALQRACRPEDAYALAAEVCNDDRAMWIVMAAYGE